MQNNLVIVINASLTGVKNFCKIIIKFNVDITKMRFLIWQSMYCNIVMQNVKTVSLS